MRKLHFILLLLICYTISSPILSNSRFPGLQKYYVGDIPYLSPSYLCRPLFFGDFNGDEVVDILVINDSDSSRVSILHGTGTGAFNPRISINLDSSSYSCSHRDHLVLDANCDGLDDVIVSEFGSSCHKGLIVHLNTNTTQWVRSGSSIPEVSNLVGVCDCNHDYHEDFIGFRGYRDMGVDWFIAPYVNLCNGDFNISNFFNPLEIMDFSMPYPLGDFNGDGWIDFLGSGSMSFYIIYVYLGSGYCQFSREQSYTTGLSVYNLIVGNFNGDGFDDIAYGTFFQANYNRAVTIIYGSSEGLLFNNGKYYVWLPTTHDIEECAILLAADINCDGSDDIGVVDKGYYEDEHLLPVYFHFSEGDSFSTQCDTLILPSDQYSRLYSDDFNRDGKADLCYFVSTDTVGVLLNASPIATFLQSFQAYFKRECGVVLEWEVTSTEDCKRFIISRAFDDESYSSIGEVEAVGSKHNYRFIDGEARLTTGGIASYRLEVIEKDGTRRVLTLENVTIPEAKFHLYQNYPNPFNPGTRIAYDLPRTERVWLEVYDVMGKLIRRLISGKELGPGRFVEYWDGTNENGEKVASGIYYSRLTVGKVSQTRKMVILQ